MKNETARREIESLDYYLQNHTDDYSEESHTAMMMAIKALGQEPCEDTISRQAVIDGINRYFHDEYCQRTSIQDCRDYLIEDVINKLPSVKPQEPCEDEYIKVPKKALKYRTAGMVAYNAEWLKNHFDIERAVICGAQEPCEDWYDVPSDEMTLGQARQAVKDLRKKLAEYFEQELCTDAISRQAAIDTIESWLPCDDYNKAERHIMRATQSMLCDLPPVNPQQKTGHWIYRIYGEFHEEGNWHCSGCDYIFNGGYGHAKFCPECGCKMSEAPTEEVMRI